MCNHNPIIIHEHGGEVTICRYCRAILKPWRARGEAGNCGIIGMVILGIALLSFGAWLIAYGVTGMQVIADIAATVVFLALFWTCLDRVCKRRTEFDKGEEVE
jgi:hypothetical protein